MSTINKIIPVSITKTTGEKIGVKECSSIVQGAVVWVGAKSFACTSLCCCVRSKKILGIFNVRKIINYAKSYMYICTTYVHSKIGFARAFK